LSSDISLDLRQLIAQRANGRCEYCQLPQKATLFKHEPDHIIPRQHGGDSSADNMALACRRCNRFKGPNIGSFDPETGDLVPFFNPRTQEWLDHFAFGGAIILALTPEARVTLKILRINAPDRVQERKALIIAGLFE